jgi:Anti-sigma factor N-terminus
MKGRELLKHKGIVLKIQNGYCYVLTPDRQFLKVPLHQDVQIGQEIEWVGQELEDRSDRKRTILVRKSLWQPALGLTAAIVLTIGIWQGSAFFHPAKAYAYVTLDINPSIELAINDKNQVLQQEALNEDGRKVLSEISVLHQSVDEAIQRITERANKDGFVAQDSDILITTTPVVHNQDSQTLKAIDQLQNSLVAEVRKVIPQKNVLIKGLTVSPDVRNAAEKVHLSAGKFAVYLQAQSQGVPVTVDQVREQPIGSLVNQNIELKQSIESTDSKILDDLLSKWNKQQVKSNQGGSTNQSSQPRQEHSSQSGSHKNSENQLNHGDTNKNENNKGQSNVNGHEKDKNGSQGAQSHGNVDDSKAKHTSTQPIDDIYSLLPTLKFNPILNIGMDPAGPKSFFSPNRDFNSDHANHSDDERQSDPMKHPNDDGQSKAERHASGETHLHDTRHSDSDRH